MSVLSRTPRTHSEVPTNTAATAAEVPLQRGSDRTSTPASRRTTGDGRRGWALLLAGLAVGAAAATGITLVVADDDPAAVTPAPANVAPAVIGGSDAERATDAARDEVLSRHGDLPGNGR